MIRPLDVVCRCLFVLGACAVFFGGCVGPRDDLESAALLASRVGTAAGESQAGSGTAGLDAGARITERFYFVAKYKATREQRQVAETVARRVAPRIVAKAKKRGTRPARYLAVRTRSDARAKTKTSVMVYDTQTQEIVGNNVYDLNTTPTPMGSVKFETYTAEYVETGG